MSKNTSHTTNVAENSKSNGHRPSRRDPFATFPFGVMPGEMGQMFDRLFETARAESGVDHWTPAATIWEDTEGYHVEMDLPGIKTEDLEVTMEAGRLMISAKRSFDKEDRRVIYNERRFGEVARSVELPDSIDPETIEASLENGLLRVDLKKRPEVLPRKIEVQIKNA
ncbi:Hsp20/alpha crystallin family protein [Neorhodopirellula pilleata]|uniref:Spore protein SP21 n=1 Tax=Neorhodopirellula pilleata TaxID=2714738 RepID=A0A5C6A2Y6_9BACT|nr:Hsp20/alpha crystallin family protein [Neorhodopirellula pilleata]TWT93618.1 Spore protein SP21 [Neorhodopirellula pilleata]